MKQTKLKYGGCGLEISATVSDTLSVGDRIIEVNAENVVNIDKNTWHEMRRRLETTLREDRHIANMVKSVNEETGKIDISDVIGHL